MTRLLKRALLLIAVLAAGACLAATANAAGNGPSIDATEYIGGVTYYANGTIAYGQANGTLIVSNTAVSSPLSGVNITMPNGSAVFVDTIGPMSSYMVGYRIGHGDVKIPLNLRETITPSSLSPGMPQQARLCIQAENVGEGNITGFKYQKTLPPGVAKAWAAYDGGTLAVNGTVTWSLDRLAPGEKKSLAIALDLTPASDVYFPGAYAWFDYDASLSGDSPGFSASTTTSFRAGKTPVSDGVWRINAVVPDDSEFVIDLKAVSISRSNASDPVNVTTIAYYTPDAALRPGCTWSASLDDRFEAMPAYFIKVTYDIPYTLDVRSYLSDPARTEPFTIAVPCPTASGPPAQSLPYVPWPRATGPVRAPAPNPEPGILFITPQYGGVIQDNATDIQVSVPPWDDSGYVAYYGSADNKTWTKLGESIVSGNMSGLRWTVPRANGAYYLKAEHYYGPGLRGIAYTQVLIAEETAPVTLTTALINETNWPMLLLALIALLLPPRIIVPYIKGKR